MDENPYKAPDDEAAKRLPSPKPWLETSDYVAIVLAVITIAAVYYGLLRGTTDLGAALSN